MYLNGWASRKQEPGEFKSESTGTAGHHYKIHICFCDFVVSSLGRDVLSALGKSLAASLKVIFLFRLWNNGFEGRKKSILDFPFDISIQFANKQWKFDTSFYVYNRAQKYTVNSSFHCKLTQK